MRARITLLLLFAILFSFTCLAQTNFEKHFTKKSLRIDFALSGNWDFQAAAIQQLREEPVWAGPVKNLIDPFGYGGYYINVNAARKSKVDDNTAKMQSIKQLGV